MIERTLSTARALASGFDKLAQAWSGAESFEDLAQRAVESCARAAHAEICTFWRVDQDGEGPLLRLAAAKGITQAQTLAQEVTYRITPGAERFDGVTGYVASERKTVLVDSYEELKSRYSFCHSGKMDPIQWQNEARKHMRNLYATPVVLGKELLGVLKVENRIGRKSFRGDVARVKALSRIAAVMAKSLVLLDAHEQRLIDVPARLSEALVRPFEAGALAQDIVDTTAKILDAEVCSLWQVDRTGRFLIHLANYGFRGEAAQVPRYEIDVDPKVDDSKIVGVTAWVAIRRKPFWANSYAELKKLPFHKGSWDEVQFGKAGAARRFHSMYAVPLVWNKELLGVLKVENPRHAAHFGQNDRRKFELMANYIVLLLVLTRQMRNLLIPDMAHVINGPSAEIATILLGIESELEEASPDLEILKTYVNLAKPAALTIATMSRTLSEEIAARVEPQSPELTDLCQFVDTQLEIIRPLAWNKVRIGLRADVTPVLPLTKSGRRWLTIVIFNLLHNALKFSPERGLIEIRFTRCPEGYLLSVLDEGPGIAPEDLDRIFEPHFHRDREGLPQGTGMGLATVRRLLGQLGWSITAGNRQPSGARFDVTIPAKGEE